jgi:tRNA 2-(methylsulfanyl)-N6-isopentenyladenosine37 hydroxylase
MLHLQYETPAAWAQKALEDTDALLLDHRFCEGKAAAMARAFIKRYGNRYPLLAPLMKDLAEEEDEHTALCEQLLKERGGILRPHHGNPYVQELRSAVHKHAGGKVIDQLLVAGMIEARSAERFRLLAEACRGDTLGRFYEDLFASEARHHALFVSLAVDLFGEETAKERLETIASLEATVMQARPWGSHIH